MKILFGFFIHIIQFILHLCKCNNQQMHLCKFVHHSDIEIHLCKCYALLVRREERKSAGYSPARGTKSGGKVRRDDGYTVEKIDTSPNNAPWCFLPPADRSHRETG